MRRLARRPRWACSPRSPRRPPLPGSCVAAEQDTGRAVRIDGTDLLRSSEGQIVEQWLVEDPLTLTTKLHGPAS
jgi:hypothetical protein